MQTILLVDDDAAYRKMLRLKLVKTGYEVREACNGKEALAQFAQATPDVVLTDLVMPEKEGLETIAELKRAHPDARIIAMSGGGRAGVNDYLKIARALGASGALVKPFTDGELGAMLDRVTTAR